MNLSAPAPGQAAPTRPRIERVEIIANESSGSVGPGAAGHAEGIVRSFGLEAWAAAVHPADLAAQLRRAVDSKPDLLVVIAGDGTARTAASLCGANGPLLAPLPGGTMNMLPRALYGSRDWKSALHDILHDGVVQPVAGGEVEGRTFYVAAILGTPALWAPAREAMRAKRFGEAVIKARYAWRRAFSSKLRVSLNGGPKRRTEALALLCPLMARSLTEREALEAILIDPSGAGDAVRLSLRALIGSVLTGAGGDWRADPAVDVSPCTHGRVVGRGHIPATFDGEPARLSKQADIHFRPIAFRALVPA